MSQPLNEPGYDDIPETALAWHRAGKGAVLATVVQTWGSAPRPVGSQLAISGAGEIMGSVSGGCVEGAVIVEAEDALKDGKSRILEFGVADETAFEVGLACGGTIRILLEPVGAELDEEMLADLVAARQARRPIAYVVDTQNWNRRLAETTEYVERFRADKSGFEDDGKTFVALHNPPLRLMVVGAVHIAQPLVQMARLAGYDVVLIDPRETFAAQNRFPHETIIEDWPDEALEKQGLDARCAVVTLSHDPKIDDPAIIAALRSDVFYLGCLGSPRTHGKRIQRLKDSGLDAAVLGRIHGPVGLSIGAKSPAEIAVSILGEMTQVLRQG